MQNNINQILEGLNEEQRKAVEAIDGPVLIIAGAGSGKTRVLTSRIAYLLSRGVDASKILALTFTKKAATQMKERIIGMVGYYQAKSLMMGTFHAIFVRILRDYAQLLGYPTDFTVADTSDSLSLIKTCIKELNLDDKVYKPKLMQSRISGAKNDLVLPEVYANDAHRKNNDQRSSIPRTIDVYARYQMRLKEQGLMDFDDILINMNILLRDHPSACAEISSRFSHIMVDEYQDTNHSQYIIIRRLTTSHNNICVVGDDSQSIYAFRGARIQNILNFNKDYKNVKIVRLERNYRSTQVIVNAANSVIGHNSSRLPKTCYSCGEQGDKIQVYTCESAEAEANRIAAYIMSEKRVNGASNADFAVLYRTNGQSRLIESSLRAAQIPYVIYSGNAFFDRAEVKDALAYLKLLVNLNDNESLKRAIASHPRGIGGTSVAALAEASRHMEKSMFECIHCEGLEAYGLKAAAIGRLRLFANSILELRSGIEHMDAYTIANEVLSKSGFMTYLKSETSEEGKARLDNVNELLNSAAEYVKAQKQEAEINSSMEQGEEEINEIDLGLRGYLENISLQSNADTTDEESDDKVALMTVHTSKGLEFPYVILAGAEENLFPSLNSMISADELEEERRLFYVALTRAKTKVLITHACIRLHNGQHVNNDVSRFVGEIDSEYVEYNDLARRSFNPYGRTESRYGGNYSGRYGSNESRYGGGYDGRYGSSNGRILNRPISSSMGSAVNSKPADFVKDDPRKFKAGHKIEHNRFGKGRILDINGIFPESRAIIKFEEYPQEKTIILSKATMRVLED